MATTDLFVKRAPFVLYLSLLPAFATACSCQKKTVDRLSSLGYYYLFFFFTVK